MTGEFVQCPPLAQNDAVVCSNPIRLPTPYEWKFSKINGKIVITEKSRKTIPNGALPYQGDVL